MRWLVACLMLAGPAAAQDDMRFTDCTDGWETFNAMLTGFAFGNATPPGSDDLADVRSQVTPDGWCRLTGGTPGLEQARFDTFDWRSEGIATFIETGAPPVTLSLRIRQIYDDATQWPPVDVDVAVRRLSGTGELLVEEFRVSDADGDLAVATALFEGAFFETRASTASSLAGIVLRRAEIGIELMPQRADSQFAEGSIVLRALWQGLDAEQISAEDRAELRALQDGYGDADGRLNMGLASARGLGLFQIVRAFARAEDPSLSVGDIANFALSGVTVTADWQPR